MSDDDERARKCFYESRALCDAVQDFLRNFERRPVAGVTIGRNYELRSLDESPGISPLGLELIGQSRDEG